MDSRHFLLIDGHALIYRAYHAFPPLTNHEGILVNAVYGFSRIILTAIRDFQPQYLALTFDHPKPTFRHQQFADYKANRVAMPDDLRPQIELIKQVTTALNIPQFELAGFEADDLIGTLTAQLNQHNQSLHNPDEQIQTIIVTGDRDTFQLVDEYTHVWLPGRTKDQVAQEYNWAAVEAKMGVCPEQIVDLKALMGDASDNIPGVKGIGEKTAVKLITTFGSVEKLYQVVGELSAGKSVLLSDGKTSAETVLSSSVLKKLVAGKDSAFLSQDLATINRRAPITLDLAQCRVTHYDKAAAAELFTKLDFKTLIALLPMDEFELGVQNALF